MNDLTCVFHLGKQCLTNIQKRELIIKFGSFFVVDCFCLKSVAVFARWVGAWKPISGMEQKGGKIID